jgi:hypothetical protein
LRPGAEPVRKPKGLAIHWPGFADMAFLQAIPPYIAYPK